MSRDIKHIGTDVHKEATVIAVLNGSGQSVMESIVETKASSILQFIHGLQRTACHLHRRAELRYQQLDGLLELRRTLRPELLAESRKYKAAKLLRQITRIGPIRAAPLDRADADPAPVPQQATAMALYWLRHRDPRQCAVLLAGQLQR